MSAAATIGQRVKARLDARGWTLRDAVAASEKVRASVSFGTWQKLASTDGEALHLAVLRNVSATLAMPLSELLGEDAAVSIPTGHIRSSPLNPRKSFDTARIAELSESLRQHGQLQPIIVRPVKTAMADMPSYEIVVGEQRWRAAAAARITTMRAIVRDVSDAELLALAITENLQRVDMTPLDTADAFLAAKKAGHKPKDIAVMAARGVRVVQEYISVAEHLCEPGRKAVQDKRLSISQAIALAGERDPKQQAADVGWAVAGDRGEEEIRALISRRKEAGAAPLFGEDAPATKPPKAQAWPKPNASGVYSLPGDGYLFERSRLTIEIHTLQIEPDVWISARRLQARMRGTAGPLTAARTWPQQWKALRWAAQDVINDLLSEMRGAAPSWRDQLATWTEAFIADVAGHMPDCQERSDAIETWRTRLGRLLAGDPSPRDANAPPPAMERVETPAADDDEPAGFRVAATDDVAWHQGQIFVLVGEDHTMRPVVRSTLHGIELHLCEGHGFVADQVRGLRNIDGWDHDDDGVLSFYLDNRGDKTGLRVYVADADP